MSEIIIAVGTAKDLASNHWWYGEIYNRLVEELNPEKLVTPPDIEGSNCKLILQVED